MMCHTFFSELFQLKKRRKAKLKGREEETKKNIALLLLIQTP